MKRLHQQGKVILGSNALLTICSDKTASQVAQLYAQLWKKIAEFDQHFSRFRHDSEVTLLNEHAGETIVISGEFRDLLLTAKKMAKITSGVFNPFILPALQRAGYKKSWAPNAATANPPDYSDREVVAYNNLEVSDLTARIPANSAIDLGGIGKGYLLDVLSIILEEAGIRDYWLSLGGDIIASGADAAGQPWSIGIANALEPSKTIASVLIPKGKKLAITTSGITRRKGFYNDKPWHHLIDATKGIPAETDIVTATVCTTSGIIADIYASCLVTLGTKKHKGFTTRHIIKDVLLQVGDENSTTMKLYGKRIALV